MAIYGKYFEYNGHKSNEFGLSILSFDSVDDVPLGLSREINRGEMNFFRVKPNHFGATYSEPLIFKVSLMKISCEDFNDNILTRKELSDISKWLTEPRFPTLFHMTDYDDSVINDLYVDYFGTISEVEAMVVAGNAVGVTFTLSCDSPFGYSQEITHKLSGGSSYIIKNQSDYTEGYLFPMMSINPLSRADIEIKNVTDKKSFTIKPLAANDTIYIDCEKMILYDVTGSFNKLSIYGITDPENMYWFRFLQGENTITITGDCEVTFKYRECRKVGAY